MVQFSGWFLRKRVSSASHQTKRHQTKRNAAGCHRTAVQAMFPCEMAGLIAAALPRRKDFRPLSRFRAKHILGPATGMGDGSREENTSKQ
jgi:hypothetical protein